MSDGPAQTEAEAEGTRSVPARVVVPALILVVVVAAAAAGAGLLVPAADLDGTGRTVVRVVGLVVAAGGLLLLAGPWRSAAWSGADALPAVLALAAGVIAVLALLSIPSSPVSTSSADDHPDERGDGYDGGGSGEGDGGDSSDDGSSGDTDQLGFPDRLVVGRAYLRLMDVDGDGTVTLAELDRDGDGRITVEELDSATGNVRVSGYDLGDLDADDFDLDRDGEVDPYVIDLDGDGIVELEDLDTDHDGSVRLSDVDWDDDARVVDGPDDRDGADDGRDTTTTTDRDDGPDRDEEKEDDDSVLPTVLRCLLLTGLFVAVVAAILWARNLGPWRRARTLPAADLPPDDAPVDADAAEAGLSASLATVAAGDDPRAAIVNAYLRLLDVLAEAGGPRRLEEAPHEHLHRVLGPLGVRPEPLHQLAELFVMARFSPHPVTEQHREQAVGLLNAALADLHARMAAMAAAAAADADGPSAPREPSHAR
jgi:uncharacterized protein DUF4129/EF hand domain-containing protein